MNKIQVNSLRNYLIISLLLSSVLINSLSATPYWTEEQILAQEQQIEILNSLPSSTLPNPPRTNPYYYYDQYLLTSNWLRSLQVTSTGVDFGGMREGETGSLYTIIQTDNTQEAIVVWSNAKRIAQNDTLFTTEISRAWIYNRQWPAWLEEGGNNSYYRSHNSGWGLAATMAYIIATGDSSVIGYGDSCANYIQNFPVVWSSNTNRNAEGIATGALAQYARWRNSQQSQRWLDTALVRGQRLREWIESNPTAVLRQSESWALSGGCAFWGVLHSICVQNPTFGISWVNQYGQFMEARPGAGMWANAWATWYGHAHTAAFAFTNSMMFLDSAVTVTDYLLDQDVDVDGGIPATVGDPQNQDQSWVSSYLCWMLLDPLIPLTGYETDLGVTAIQQPRGLLGIGDSIRCSFSIVNFGRQSMIPSLYIRYGSSSNTLQTLSFADTDSLVSNQRRTFTRNLGIASAESLIIRIRIANIDSNSSNDSMTLLRTVSPAYSIPISISIDSAITLPISINTIFQSVVDSNYTKHIDTTFSTYTVNTSIRLPLGSWFISHVTPPPLRQIRQQITVGPSSTYQVSIPKASLWLLDDDSTGNYRSYYTSVLDSIHSSYRIDEVPTVQNFSSILSQFQIVVWFTGDRLSPIDLSQRIAINNALNQGVNLLLTGQNIGESIHRSDSTFLQRFGISLRSYDTNIYRIYGVAGTPWVGVNTLLAGSYGAGNQTSQDGFNLLENGVAWSSYQGQPTNYSVVVTNAFNSGKTAITGFGLESVSGLGMNSRSNLIATVLEFFQSPTFISPETVVAIPNEFQVIAYPNPFNSSLFIQWNSNYSNSIDLTVYNQLGKQVLNQSSMNGYGKLYLNAENFASGKYYVRLRNLNEEKIIPIVLIR